MRAARLELQIANLRHAAGAIGKISTAVRKCMRRSSIPPVRKPARHRSNGPIPVFERPVIFWGVAGPRFPIENQFNAVRQVTARDQHCASAIAMAATVICPDLPQCRLQPFSVRYCSPLIGEIRLASVGRFVGR
jgi:hypothetical protein